MEKEHQTEQVDLVDEHQEKQINIEEEYQAEQVEIEEKYQTEQLKIEKEYQEEQIDIKEEYQANQVDNKEEYQTEQVDIEEEYQAKLEDNAEKPEKYNAYDSFKTEIHEGTELQELEQPEEVLEYKVREETLNTLDEQDNSDQVISIIEQEVVYVQEKNEMIDLYDKNVEDNLQEQDIEKQEIHTVVQEEPFKLELITDLDTEIVETVEPCHPREIHVVAQDIPILLEKTEDLAGQSDVSKTDVISDQKEIYAVTHQTAYDTTESIVPTYEQGTVTEVKDEKPLVTKEQTYEVSEIIEDYYPGQGIEQIHEMKPAEKIQVKTDELYTLTQEETVFTEVAEDISPQHEERVVRPQNEQTIMEDTIQDIELHTTENEEMLFTEKAEDLFTEVETVVNTEQTSSDLKEIYTTSEEETVFTEQAEDLSQEVQQPGTLLKEEQIIPEEKPTEMHKITDIDLQIVPIIVSEPDEDKLSPEEREISAPYEETIVVSPVSITRMDKKDSDEMIFQLDDDIERQKTHEETIQLPTRKTKDIEKELSSSSTMSDEDLVEKPNRISFSDDHDSGQVIQEEVQFTLDDIEGEKSSNIEQVQKQASEEKVDKTTNEMVFSTLSSNADLQEEIVDIDEYTPEAKRIDQNLQREADEEMFGIPYDFVARRKSSGEPEERQEQAEDTSAHVIDVIEPSEKVEDLETEIPSDYYEQAAGGEEENNAYSDAVLFELMQQAGGVDQLRDLMSDDTIKMELDWEPPSKKSTDEDELNFHTAEKKVAYDEKHDVSERKDQYKSDDMETCDIKTKEFHKTFSAEIRKDTLVESKTTTKSVAIGDKLYEEEEHQQKTVTDDHAVTNLKSEMSEHEFHAVKPKDSDIDIKETEKKEVLDQTFAISVKKDTDLLKSEKKHDGEIKEITTDETEKSVRKDTKTVIEEKTNEELEYKVDKETEEIKMIRDDSFTDIVEHKIEEEITDKIRKIEKVNSQDSEETFIDRKEVKQEMDISNTLTDGIQSDKHVRFLSETAEIGPYDDEEDTTETADICEFEDSDMSESYIDRMEKFLYLPDDTDPTKVYNTKTKQEDFTGEFTGDSTDRHDDAQSPGYCDEEGDQQSYGPTDTTPQVDEEGVEIKDFDFSRKLSAAEVDELEHELRMEQTELEKIIKSETATEGTDTPQSVDDRPLSPSSYTLETDTDMEGSRSFEPDELMDENFDVSQQIFIEHKIQSEKSKLERPPSPSDFTLITSLDQDALTKLLGLEAKDGKLEFPEHDPPVHDKESEFSTTSNELNIQEPFEFDTSENVASQSEATTYIPPIHQQMESLQRSEGRNVFSSYENVYDGVPLDPKINRMSADASELDIGDRFDTKQNEQLQASDRSSSYEKIYEQESREIIGESKTSQLQTSISSRHACPIYITVEEGLDKLSGEETNIHKDFKERSLSCESQLEIGYQEDLRYRHSSSPDMSAFTPSTYLSEFSKALEEDKSSVSSSHSEVADDLQDQGEAFVREKDSSEIPIQIKAARLHSIDDGTAEYDITEHPEFLQGIPEHLAQKSGPDFTELKDKPEKDDDQSEGAEGGEVQKARMVMTKQIHTTTVLKDGQEQTTVHEETNVQEDDTPNVLRESMQGIIDQFMEQPPNKEKPTSHETEI
ncbi:Hypothetical predicted protein [Mytilus galloprovincialis]|uniref:Uncharacterized protein n=1 Tax=Mytilus galloprovincialis TaxID=29158 RepID=A0A8B6EN01_MYTGA|nr:Hypothetical predicted protein [Mytilus galloprovincialis]